MSVSYRYLMTGIAVREAELVQEGKFDVHLSLSKDDFHLRPFSDIGVTDDRLIEIRQAILNLYDLKSSADVKGNCVPNFDSIFVKSVLEIFDDMTLMDGFSKEVWSYLTLRLLPDLALWRWPKNNQERFVGGAERSCFQRLWQRSFVIGPDLASKLQEDEAVNIFERPEALGGNRKLSIAFSEFIVRNRGVLDGGNGSRIVTSEIVKKSAKRLRRSMSIQVVQSMTAKELEASIAFAFGETLRGSKKI